MIAEQTNARGGREDLLTRGKITGAAPLPLPLRSEFGRQMENRTLVDGAETERPRAGRRTAASRRDRLVQARTSIPLATEKRNVRSRRQPVSGWNAKTAPGAEPTESPTATRRDGSTRGTTSKLMVRLTGLPRGSPCIMTET